MRAGPSEESAKAADEGILLLAEGFGTGRIPVGPGTFGTLVGLPWIWLLLQTGSAALYLLGTFAGLAAALWIGARAEQILQKKDPGSIVIDEIAALPIAFLPVVLSASQVSGSLAKTAWIELLLSFVLFRVFDIWKPLGIRQSQNLKGGLVLDDVLAAMAAALVLWAILLLRA